jgi:hypothetical protein
MTTSLTGPYAISDTTAAPPAASANHFRRPNITWTMPPAPRLGYRPIGHCHLCSGRAECISPRVQASRQLLAPDAAGNVS